MKVGEETETLDVGIGVYRDGQRCRSVYIAFSCCQAYLFFLSRQIKTEIVYSSCFFYKEVYLLIVIFLEITNTHVLCTTIIEQRRRQ